MKKILYTLMAACLAFAACETEFEPAADPQAYPQEDARTLPTAFTVNPVGSIAIASVSGASVQVATLGASTLPSDATYGPFTVILDGKYALEADENLFVSKDALQNAVAELFGKRPEERTIPAVVKSSVQIENQGFRLESNEFVIKVTPEAPALESHYYYIGAANGWSSTDKTYEFTNKGGDYYDDPVVSVTIPAPVDDSGNRVDNWFKIAPGSAYERGDAFWNGTFIGAAENGESAYEGKFVMAHNDVVGAFNVGPGSEEAVYYTITLNLLDQTYSVKALNFPAHLYMIGAEFGGWDWNSTGVVEMTPVLHNPDWGAEAEGQFWTVRYFTAGQGFKFCSKREWGGDFWGLDTNEGFTEDGGNCVVSEDGFYLVHIDMKRRIVHVEPARVYGIGDAFGGWNEAMEDARFKPSGKTMKATVAKSANIRMYVESSISTSGWWTREFNILDGKIEPRIMDELPGVPARAGQEVVLDFNAGTGQIKGEGETPTLPENMYIIGDGVGGWDWGASYIVDMTPVNTKDGQFWAIRYIEAGKGFKFNSKKEWGGDFTGLGNDSGFTVDGGNCYVSENGVYMIYVDAENGKVVVEPAKVYGKGDCFGGWSADPVAFTVEGNKVVGTTTGTGEIRLYADSSAATSDWWTREFVFFDGKIAYRGKGGDQDRVTVEAGKKVTLDFNAGTATVE